LAILIHSSGVGGFGDDHRARGGISQPLVDVDEFAVGENRSR
jgi:hypothetical protein